jgi:hypothetical protein
MMARGLQHRPELEERYARSEPLRRLGEPEEIGEAVAWLWSECASYVTGLPMPVDSGFMEQWKPRAEDGRLVVETIPGWEFNFYERFGNPNVRFLAAH